MINLTLYKQEMKNSFKILFIFSVVITLYVSIIMSMYNPDMMKTLDSIVESMPEIMASVGMTTGSTSLIGFMISYLYGFILLIFPMLFCMIRANGLIAKYTDKGSMVTLLAAPIKRKTLCLTQLCVLLSGLFFLVLYTTVLEIMIAEISFPNELMMSDLLILNGSLFCLHLFIGSICFLCSCLFSDIKYSLGFGVGIPIIMYVLQMLANAGEKAEIIKYLTFFTLFDANGIIAHETNAMIGIILLFVGAILLYSIGVMVFCKKDLHI